MKTTMAKSKRQYWIFSPGENADCWEYFSRDGIIAIDWVAFGNLSKYATKWEMQERMRECYEGENKRCSSLWNFYHEMKVGDIVFVRKGVSYIIGCCTVNSGYQFNETLDEYRNIRKIRDVQKGCWEIREGFQYVPFDENAPTPLKKLAKIGRYTLTKLDADSERVGSLKALFGIEGS